MVGGPGASSKTDARRGLTKSSAVEIPGGTWELVDRKYAWLCAGSAVTLAFGIGRSYTRALGPSDTTV